MQKFIKELDGCASNKEEVDLLSRKEEKTKKGPISKLLQNLSFRKFSNKSDSSKLSISTQYTYPKNENRFEQENISEVSDFELDQLSDSFHSSVNDSNISDDQIANFSDELEIEVDENEMHNDSNEKEIDFSQFKPRSIKPLINLKFMK